jgi:hypothetical protein
LVKIGENEAYFDGITFRKLADGGMEAFILIHRKDGRTVEARFDYRPAAEFDRRAADKGKSPLPGRRR